jgi:CubicO group peptidase (beta-lactamase class C family)
MTADTRMNIASPSKTITTAAVMRALEILKAKGKSVTLESPIAPYLPTGWSKGPHVDAITLKDLLRHAAGFTMNFELYDDLRQMIADGPSNWTDRYTDGIYATYNNSNFTLLRIILPYMVYGREAIEGSPQVAAQVAALEAEIAALQEELKSASPAQKPAIAAQIKQLQKQKAQLPGQPGESVEMRTAKLYVQFVQKEVLAKVGLGNIWINPKSPAEAITFYNFANPAKSFAGFSDDIALRSAAASYWFMSAKEYGRFIAGLRNGKIVSASSYKTMHDAQVGMFYLDTAAGDARYHNGRYTFDNKSGMRSAWVAFPNGVTAVLFMNSYNPALEFPQDTLIEAFSATLKMQQLAAK